jgi:hypothetical protein
MDSLPPKIEFDEIRLIAKQVLALMQQEKVTEAQQKLETIFTAIDQQDSRYHQWSLTLKSLSNYFK